MACSPVLRAVQAEAATCGRGSYGRRYRNVRFDVGHACVTMTMMMEISMIPTPAAVKSDTCRCCPRGKPDGVSPTFLLLATSSSRSSSASQLQRLLPSQITRVQLPENYSTQPTRMYFQRGNDPTLSAGASNAVNTGLATLATDALYGVPRGVQSDPVPCTTCAGSTVRTSSYTQEFRRGQWSPAPNALGGSFYLPDALRTPGIVSGGNGEGTPPHLPAAELHQSILVLG